MRVALAQEARSSADRAVRPPPEPSPSASERLRVLAIATAGFTVFFAVWVMFAIVGLPVRKELGLGDGEFALLAAIPILTGSVLRVPIGILTDKVGGRAVFTALLLVTAVPTYLVSRADSYGALLVLAFFIGIAGTSFAAGIAWVSAWYPAERQGFALGTFGAGNVGASVTKLVAPVLVTAVAAGGVAGGVVPGGWRLVPFVYALLLVATAAAVLLLAPARDLRPARGRPVRDQLDPLRYLRVWRFGLYYVVVFGAYVALSLWLPKYYVDVYGQDLRVAGLLTSLFIFPASLLRPLGGWLSDRLGARPVTYTSFVVMCAALAGLSFSVELWVFTGLVVTVGVMMGIGKASVYKYISDYFPRDVGAVGGLVGAVGGLGGFVLPLLFAFAQGVSGRPQSTFVVLLAGALVSLAWLHVVVWRMHRAALAGRPYPHPELQSSRP
jgi:NNP family nitrate/nitrite transporter-like MFS transporter